MEEYDEQQRWKTDHYDGKNERRPQKREKNYKKDGETYFHLRKTRIRAAKKNTQSWLVHMLLKKYFIKVYT